MRKPAVIFLLLLCGCAPASTRVAPWQTSMPPSIPTTQPTETVTAVHPSLTPSLSLSLATLPDRCNSSGTIASVSLPQSTGDEAYSYRVYLPPCYEADTEFRYPVLYLIPGSKSSPDSWLKAGLPKKMDKLILAKKIPPMIVVATENTDTDLNGETIYTQLIPAVESHYPIANDRRYRAVAGGSLGGISAYHLAFQHPNTFSSAGLFGSGIIPGEERQVRLWLSATDDSHRMRVFMNSGTQDAYMLERARAMKSVLDDLGVENELYEDDSGHHYKYWIPNFERYLIWMSKNW